MPVDISIEHTTFGIMGPLAHTATRSMSIHCVIFRVGDRVILLDTGFGTREMAEPNRLLGDDALFKLGIVVDQRLTAVEQLKARGIAPRQVTDIVLTHMDNDHAGGLHDFPDAVVHVSKEEIDAFDGLRPRGPYKPYQISHLTKFKIYERSEETWFGLEARSLNISQDLDLKLIPLPGHTVGHCGVAYRENGIWSLHAGDAYFDRDIHFRKHPPGLPLEMAFQTDPHARVASLRKLHELRDADPVGLAIFCTHDQQEYAGWAGLGPGDDLLGTFGAFG